MMHENIKKLANEAVDDMKSIIELGRSARNTRCLSMKLPLKELIVISPDTQFLNNLELLKSYIIEELNIKNLVLTSDKSRFVKEVAIPKYASLGVRLKGARAVVSQAIEKLEPEQISELKEKGKLKVLDHEIFDQDVTIETKFTGGKDEYEASWAGNILVVLNLQKDEQLEEERLAREIVNRVQRLRKEAGLNVGDPVETFYHVSENTTLAKVAKERQSYLVSILAIPLLPMKWKPEPALEVIHATREIGDDNIELWITRKAFSFDDNRLRNLAKEVPDDNKEKWIRSVRRAINSRDYDRTVEELKNAGKFSGILDGHHFELLLGQDIFLSANDKLEKLGW